MCGALWSGIMLHSTRKHSTAGGVGGGLVRGRGGCGRRCDEECLGVGIVFEFVACEL